MITRRWSFETEGEVWAFIQGIEFANDSTLSVEKDKDDPLIVYTKDRKDDTETNE